MSVKLEMNDHSDEVLDAMNDRIAVILEKIGLVAEGYAKRLCPVDTGNLRNSITHAVKGKTVYIGTNVEYAPYVELGTSSNRPQPYLRPAVLNHTDEYRRIARDTLKGG